MSLLSEFYTDKRGQASGFHQTGGSLGSFVTPLITDILLFTFNWKLSIAFLSIPGFALSIVLRILLKEPKQQGEKEAEQKIKEED